MPLDESQCLKCKKHILAGLGLDCFVGACIYFVLSAEGWLVFLCIGIGRGLWGKRFWSGSFGSLVGKRLITRIIIICNLTGGLPTLFSFFACMNAMVRSFMVGRLLLKSALSLSKPFGVIEG